MQTNVERLQKQYPEFRYKGFSRQITDEGLSVMFSFEIGEHKFFPKLLFRGITNKELEGIEKKVLDFLLFHLGLAEIPSYWKLTCSPQIIIEAGYLNTMQVAFWKKLIEKGMGEFFFVNDITPFAPDIVISAPKPVGVSELNLPHLKSLDHVLVPVGGGKDSIVTMELMKKAGKKLTFFTVGKDQASEDIISIFEGKYGKVPRLQIDRKLDPTLLELNIRGYLNGHTPFSSIIAFTSFTEAIFARLPLIALSNEKSANEETGVYQGVNINHQYSKTFEFESDFRAYIETQFDDAPVYFSLLRPLFEIQISQIFTRYPEYFSVFRSCNIGKKTNSWCGDCAKCLFVFLLLSAFIPPGEVIEIFGKDLFSNPELVPLLKQLTGDAPMKAFECVGTRAETMVALYLSWKKRRQEKPLPIVLASYLPVLSEKKAHFAKEAVTMLSSFDGNHLIPESLVKVVKNEIK